MLSTVPATGALAAGDPAAGETLFKQKCAVCHKIGEGAKNFVGPELNGIIGRKAGAAPGYSYSEGVKNAGFDLGRGEAQQMAHQSEGR